MRCPSCAAENPAGIAVCAGCGSKLTRSSRRRGAARLSHLLVQRIPNNPPAVTAYRYALYGLIPIVGLILGVFAFGFGIAGYRFACVSPEGEGRGHAVAGMILGSLEFLSNSIGLIFIATGFRSLS